MKSQAAKVKMGRTIAEAIGVKAKRGHKYGAQAVEIDGLKFPSKAEGKRYCDLRLMRDQGLIMDLQVHVRFPLIVNGMQVSIYECDATYFDCETQKTVVEDTKGKLTRIYSLKRKLMKACLGIDIVEIGRKPRKKRRKAS